ncbi:putative oligomerization/nucleic acid binding protein [Nesterenkonia sandarakina]|uniref:Putative oligomerization/nucleic acid binding protein n=1 Tax=Nesterenkonia sandarakina TaxID=272918 RepID=A0A2T0YTP3_9MICC|nr:putative oligomerization/nucleic acid binding protein [Nesterenkonia sandarakina]
MLGSRKGMRDITRGVNDSRSGFRQIKIAFAAPERRVELLTQERDARLSEASKAHSKAIGWGAKKFIQVAERAEHEAGKAQAQLEDVWRSNPELRPAGEQGAVGVGAAGRMAELSELHSRGLISEEEFEHKRRAILEGL